MLQRLEHATLSTLRESLRHHEYHVFHYVGHGVYDPSTAEGFLVLEDENSRSKLVSGSRLKSSLADESSLRLVVLNSCQGGRTSTIDPFGGTAQGLVQAGIPAVIAMQFEISDEAAIKFGQEFYGALADYFPVDEALTEARRAIYQDVNDIEWATPVLYMRSPDGVLFSPASPVTSPSERSNALGSHAATDSPRGQEYANAVASFQRRDWNDVVERLTRMDPDSDPEQIAAAAKEGLRRQKTIEGYRQQASDALRGKRWQEALAKVHWLLALDSTSEPGDITDAAQDGLNRERQITLLYQDACSLMHRQLYSEALAKVKEIRNLEPQFAEAQGIEAQAQGRLAEEQTIATLYAEARELLQKKQWRGAWESLMR